MSQTTWLDVLVGAVKKHEKGDSMELIVIAQLLLDQEAAKSDLRRKGYGGTGITLVQAVAQVPVRH